MGVKSFLLYVGVNWVCHSEGSTYATVFKNRVLRRICVRIYIRKTK